jgi:hypothetical protein
VFQGIFVTLRRSGRHPSCMLHLPLFIAPFLKTRSNNSSAFKGTADMAQELADFCL